jgi:NitT/TauT family transport system substrate-binding protein
MQLSPKGSSMRDAGVIKSSPQKIIADGTDFRLFNELKRVLKA